MQVRNKNIDNHGFTLIEVLITMLISGIVIGSIYSAFKSQQDSYVVQDDVTEMQQNIRASVGRLVRDIRMAGYDPSESANVKFNNTVFENGNFTDGGGNNTAVTSTATAIAFYADLDGDGTVDEAAEDINGDGNIDMTEIEQIGYRLNGTELERYSTTTGGQWWQDIAENIERLEFVYLDSDGNIVAPGSDVRTVQISVLARAAYADPKFTNTMTYTPASGVPWDLNGAAAGNAPNDNFRRRLLITRVVCRNIGL